MSRPIAGQGAGEGVPREEISMTSDGSGNPDNKATEIPVSQIVERVPVRIVVFSGKGGVGKTTVAVNLAASLARKDLSIGLLDADITGPNVGLMLGIEDAASISGERILPHKVAKLKVVTFASMVPEGAAVVWRGPLRSRAIEQLLDETEWGSLDALVVDLPPGTGDEILTIAQRLRPQIAVVVTTPQHVALADARRAVDFAGKLGIGTIGLVENMSGAVCPSCGDAFDLFGAGTAEREANALGVGFFGKVPFDPAIPPAGDAGLLTTLLGSDHPTAAAFRAVAESVWVAFPSIEGETKTPA